jgi:hypothetical protein
LATEKDGLWIPTTKPAGVTELLNMIHYSLKKRMHWPVGRNFNLQNRPKKRLIPALICVHNRPKQEIIHPQISRIISHHPGAPGQQRGESHNH